RNRVSTDFSLGAERFRQVGSRDDGGPPPAASGGIITTPGVGGETRISRRTDKAVVLLAPSLVSPLPPGFAPARPATYSCAVAHSLRGSHDLPAAAAHGPRRDARRRLAQPPVRPRPRQPEAPGPRARPAPGPHRPATDRPARRRGVPPPRRRQAR